MGSYAQATMTGFICRLCSEHKKSVIHFYSARAKELQLLKKLTLLPITVEKYDNLPKTICHECIEKLDLQYQLVLRIRKSLAVQRKHRLLHSNGNCPVECPLHGVEGFETIVPEEVLIAGDGEIGAEAIIGEDVDGEIELNETTTIGKKAD